jgi:hypothetical protein
MPLLEEWQSNTLDRRNPAGQRTRSPNSAADTWQPPALAAEPRLEPRDAHRLTTSLFARESAQAPALEVRVPTFEKFESCVAGWQHDHTRILQGLKLRDHSAFLNAPSSSSFEATAAQIPGALEGLLAPRPKPLFRCCSAEAFPPSTSSAAGAIFVIPSSGPGTIRLDCYFAGRHSAFLTVIEPQADMARADKTLTASGGTPDDAALSELRLHGARLRAKLQLGAEACMASLHDDEE